MKKGLIFLAIFFFFSGMSKAGDSTRFDVSFYDKHKILSLVLIEHVFGSLPRMKNEKQFAKGRIFIQCFVENGTRTLKIYYDSKLADENIIPVEFIFKREDLVEIFCAMPRHKSIEVFRDLKGIRDMMTFPLMNLGFTKEELILAGINPNEEYNKEYYLVWKEKEKEKRKIDKALQKEKKETTVRENELSAEKAKEMRSSLVTLTEKPSMPKGVFSKPTTISLNKKFSSVFEKGEITNAIEKKFLKGKYNSQRGNYGTLYFSPYPFAVDFELHPEGGYSLYFFLKKDKESAVITHPAEFVLRGENVFWLSFWGSDEDLALILTVLLEKKILKKGAVKIPSNLSENARKEWEELPGNDWDLKETRRRIELANGL